MSDIPHDSVREQFNRQAAHYLGNSAMADRQVLDAIVSVTAATPHDSVLDVACGAGFLVEAFAKLGCAAVGVDISEAMLKEARSLLQAAHEPASLVQGDVQRLPFRAASFGIVTCKLALHYFQRPAQAMAEIVRVCVPGGKVVLTDRIAREDAAARAAQNEIERLRTPSKIRVYALSELCQMMAQAGLAVRDQRLLRQSMDFTEWMEAAGAASLVERVRTMILQPGSPLSVAYEPTWESGRLRISHLTAIVVATRPR